MSKIRIVGWDYIPFVSIDKLDKEFFAIAGVINGIIYVNPKKLDTDEVLTICKNAGLEVTEEHLGKLKELNIIDY